MQKLLSPPAGVPSSVSDTDRLNVSSQPSDNHPEIQSDQNQASETGSESLSDNLLHKTGT
jgi:hypothetical protein